MLGSNTKDTFKPKENYNKWYSHHTFGPFPDDMYYNAHNSLSRVWWGLQYAKQHEPKNVLDLGCLDGFNLATLSVQADIEKGTGVDLSLEGIERATLKAKKFDLPLTFINQSAEDFLSETKEKYDMICLHEFIEHVIDPVSLLQSVNKVLKPGGSVLISTPDFDGAYGKGNQDPCHLRIYTVKRGEMPEYEKPVISLAEQVESVGGKVRENLVQGELVQVRYTL